MASAPEKHLIRALAPLLGLAALQGISSAQGQQICFEDTIPLQPTNWVGETLTVSKFDPNLGILTGISFTLEGTAEGSAGIESLDATRTTVTTSFQATLTLQRPDLSEIVVAIPAAMFSDDLTEYDGITDFRGTSGITHAGIQAMATEVASSPPPQSDLALFTGPAGNPGTITLPVEGIGTSTADGGGNLITQFMTSASCTLTVCYFYGDDCNENGVADSVDIATGTSQDCNENGIPDECDGGCPPDEIDCAEFDRFENLTPLDTLTLITNFHNPEMEQGYVYLYATQPGGSTPVAHDYLIGQMLVVNGFETFEYSMNAFDYAAEVGPGMPTDLDMDGVRDLNGLEYQKTAGEIFIPRFLGQEERVAESDLFLIALSGGTEFDTTVDFLIYNDNENPFSGAYTFNCYAKVRLLDISAATSNEFLKNASNDDDDESVGTRESGWIRLNGGVASSTTLTIHDPAFLAAYVERIGDFAAGDLPFERCLQDGHLLPDGLNGDNSEESSGGAPTQSCEANLPRRMPGSLLIYHEFDNRLGTVSVLTVSNTALLEETRAHFHYIGRYVNP